VTEPASDKPKTGLSRRTKLALGCVLSPLVLILVVGIVGGFGYWIFLRRGHNEMTNEIKLVRNTGAPLNSIELHRKYIESAVENTAVEDITDELAAQLAFSANPEFHRSVLPLPFLGTVRDVPPPGAEWPQRAEVEAFLADHQAWLDYCATLPERQFKIRFAEDLRFGLAPALTRATRLSTGMRILTLQIRVDMHRRQPEEAVKRILQQLVLAKCVVNEPLPASHSRIFYIDWALQSLALVLQHGEVADDDLVRLQKLLREFDFRAALKLSLEGERAACFTEMSLPAEWYRKRGGAPEDVIMESESRLPARKGDAARMLSSFRRLVAANDESLHAAIKESKALDEESKQLMKSPTRLVYVQSLLLLAGLQHTPLAHARLDAKCRCMDTLLAAIRYHRAKDRWPTLLEQLTPDFLPAVPIDPFALKPLRLLVTDQEFKIYSVGENELDDGGTWTDRVQTDVGFALPIK
jgi:hypothetical protein